MNKLNPYQKELLEQMKRHGKTVIMEAPKGFGKAKETALRANQQKAETT